MSSQLKVNSISDAAGANGNAITLATNGTCTSKVTNNLSNRNLVTNGSCIIAQRGTSYTSDQQNYQTVDRFRLSWSGADSIIEQHQGTLTSSDTGPWEKGFRKEFHIVNGNQSSGAGAGDQVVIETRIEAQDLANSGWDYTSTSSYITLSFWVKAEVSQTYYGVLETQDGTGQNYPFSFTASSTWSKVTKTIPGNSNLQFDNNNGNGLQIEWHPFMGTNLTDNSVSLNTWAAAASGTRHPDMTSTWYTTDDATFELTGVQLEVGDSATDFAFEAYPITKLRCQRYFNRPCCGMFHSSQSNADDHGIIRGFRYSTYGGINYCYPIEMRSNPTLTFDEMRDSDGSNTNITEQVGTQHISIFMLATNPYIADMRLDAEL